MVVGGPPTSRNREVRHPISQIMGSFVRLPEWFARLVAMLWQRE